MAENKDVYITTYALTSGIDIVSVPENKKIIFHKESYHEIGKNAFYDKRDALFHAERMRGRRIVELENKRKKLIEKIIVIND